jgi:hypothetical protein
MRAGLLLCLSLLAGCASEKLALSPPAGTDLSGHWKLNFADSDDPLRLGQALDSAGNPAATGSQSGGRGGRGGGRGGGQGGGPGGAAPSGLGPSGGPPLGASAVNEILQWPGRDLEVTQSAGVATFESDNDKRVYQPTQPGKKKTKRGAHRVVGWSGPTLVIAIDPDDDRPRYEEHYELSSDGQRLLQLVLIKSGRMTGFSMSRVWDRVP